ncbi:MAG: YHS domain-containing (seleno)protein [Bermanella sp.]
MSKLSLTKLSLATVALVTAVSFTASVMAADEHNVVPGLTAVGAPLGLHGMDPVSFIQIGNRIAGSAAYTDKYDGVAYYFSSQKNMTTFKQNPKKYTPKNGGFCTFGVSVGKKFDGNPNYASVENGKLYVFLNEDIYKLYQKDRKGTIKSASQKWSKIQHSAAATL